MSFSASFNGRPLLTNKTVRDCKDVVKSDFPEFTKGYYNVLKGARGNADAFAKAVTMLAKGR